MKVEEFAGLLAFTIFGIANTVETINSTVNIVQFEQFRCELTAKDKSKGCQHIDRYIYKHSPEEILEG